ncbi:DUF4411 family protein [Xylocopilactobacillus apis]|nr:DUF4411 family protein [Xylocopilactobacillus apis]
MKWYNPEVFSKLWIELNKRHEVQIIDYVNNEIEYPDELVTWVKEKHQKNEIEINEEIISVYNKLIKWVRNCSRWSEAGFAEWQKPEKADPWLIAIAKVNDFTIVTLDGNLRTSLPDKKSFSNKEPKISAVANRYEVSTIPMYELLKEMELSF